jgi:hypothetical protein
VAYGDAKLDPLVEDRRARVAALMDRGVNSAPEIAKLLKMLLRTIRKTSASCCGEPLARSAKSLTGRWPRPKRTDAVRGFRGDQSLG